MLLPSINKIVMLFRFWLSCVLKTRGEANHEFLFVSHPAKGEDTESILTYLWTTKT